jgi:hypothetical protein
MTSAMTKLLERIDPESLVFALLAAAGSVFCAWAGLVWLAWLNIAFVPLHLAVGMLGASQRRKGEESDP